MVDLFNWESIIIELGPRLYRHFCVRFSDEQADDLTQESLIRLVQKVESGAFDSSKGNLRMYAFGIAHFIALESSKSVIELPIEEIADQLGT
jgi:DNA-directed RNA polymerase specialized sigma24 family protein